MARQQLDLKKYEEIQDDEFVALKSIFGDDVRDLRVDDVWKVRRPPELDIRLLPLHSSSGDVGGGGAEVEPYALVNVHIKCPPRYPDVPPAIELKAVKGLSSSDAAALLAELRTLAADSVGEVMLYGLAQHAQAFLHANSKPPTSSFYDEMLSRRRQQEERLREERRQHEQALLRQHERERLEIEEEIRGRQEAAKEARVRRDEGRKSESIPIVVGSTVAALKDDGGSRKSNCNSPSDRVADVWREQEFGGSGVDARRPPRPTSLATADAADLGRPGPSCKRHAHSACLTFSTKQPRTVHRGQCIGHGSSFVTYSAIDASSGELCAVTEWTLPFQTFGKKLDADQQRELDNEMAKYLKQVAAAEQELMSLLKLHHHGLLHYIAFQFQKVEATIVIQVLREHCCGWSLDMYRRQMQLVDLQLLRKYATDLVDSLLYLHGNAVAHKAIRADSVYIDESGDLRLADYSLTKRLNDLQSSLVSLSPQQQQSTALAAAPGKRWQKEDIYQLGLLLLSLWTGDEVSLKEALVDGPSALPAFLPAALQDFLARCLHADDRQRWPASELKEHAFLRDALCHAPGHPAAAAAYCGDARAKLAAVNAAARAARHTGHMRQGGGDRKQAGLLDDVNDDEDGRLYMLPQPDHDGVGGGNSTVAAAAAACQTRLTTEFQVLELLGRGGFGAVLKVRNKLDGRLYAIKRIPLNSKGSEHLNRKITREVKLLSRLNHENVVRYYNSWLEVSFDQVDSSDSSYNITAATKESDAVAVKPPRQLGKSVKREMECGDSDNDLEGLVAANVPERVEESGSWASDHRSAISIESSVSSSPEEESVFGPCLWPFPATKGDCESDSIIAFDHASPHQSTESNSKSAAAANNEDQQQAASSSQSSIEGVRKVQYMCIQMEFCEKSTLRNCIDMGLHQDMDRVWRLFREIVEGLVHIHEQGMIHRDLKPVNIFLDSNDHVKIGDFGLATTETLGRTARSLQHQGDTDSSLLASLHTSMSDGPAGPAGASIGGDTGHTGQVGTALYVSPEILSSSGKTSYSQKVDIYSLGVIFFEMCYKPLPTAMQRMCILSDIRRPEINLPEDFAKDGKMEKQAAIVRWLLDHDSLKRPTAAELLQSPLLPPPLLEESELQEIVRSTVANPQSRGYKKLMTALFQQPVPRKFEVGYDEYLQRGLALKVCRTHEHVKDVVAQVFRNHGAIAISIPLLLPKLAAYEENESQVCLMDYAGGLVALPFDLRVPFARFVARSNVTSIKRYAIERVYRETKPHGMHPREHWECAFDIVTPLSSSAAAASSASQAVEPHSDASGSPEGAAGVSRPLATSLLPDAEVLLVVREVIDRFPALAEKIFVCHVNHVCLLHSVLLHCGVPQGSVSSTIRALAAVGSSTESKLGADGRRALFRNVIAELKLSPQAVAEIPELLSIEGPFNQVSSKMKKITKTKSEASSLAKRGLHELEVLVSYLESLGPRMPPRVNVGLLYAAQHSSGVMFQVMTTSTNSKHRNQVEVFAAGNRYNPLIDMFHLPWNNVSAQCGVGVSIAFDHIVACVLAKKEVALPGHIDVLLCATGRKPYLTEQLSLARDLWASGIKVDILCDGNVQDVESVHELCRDQHISCLVLFKDNESPAFVRVRTFDKDKVTDKKLTFSEAVEQIKQSLSRSDSHEAATATPSKAGQPTSSQAAAGDSQQQAPAGSAGGSSSSSGSSYSGGAALLASIIYMPADEKMNLKDKKKAESQVSSRLQGSSGVPPALVSLSRSSQLHVIAAEVTADVVRTIASFLEVGSTAQAFMESQEEVFSRHKRHKKYLERVFDKIHELKFQRKGCVVIVYGLKDDTYRLLL